MLRTSAWRVREYCSRAYRKTDEQRKQKAGESVERRVTTGSREGSGGTASRARTHIAGWSPFWEVGEFLAKGKVDGQRKDGRMDGRRLCLMCTNLWLHYQATEGATWMCVCAGGRFVVVPLRCCSFCCCCACRLFTLSAWREGQRRGSCHPIEAMGRCLSSLLSFKQVGLREPPEQYQSWTAPPAPTCLAASVQPSPPPRTLSSIVSRVALAVAGNFLR